MANDIAGDIFASRLQNGDFTILIEAPSPGPNVDPEARIAMLNEFDEALKRDYDGVNVTLAITDHKHLGKWRGVEYAAKLPPERRAGVVVYLSGAGTTPDELDSIVAFARANGIRNIVPISGGHYSTMSEEVCRENRFMESTDMLQRIGMRGKDGDFFLGTTVNPYQYEPYTLFSQYFKLIKKLSLGAKFVVAQCGWDMLRTQSLIWYLNQREIFIPVIPRTMFLSPTDAQNLHDGSVPGIRLSDDMLNVFKSDYDTRFSHDELMYEVAQYQRVSKQALGFRMIGGRGIQIGGSLNSERANAVVARIVDELGKCDSFETYLQDYKEHLMPGEMTLYQRDFKLYDLELSRDYSFEEPPTMHIMRVEPPKGAARAARKIKELLFSHADVRRADSLMTFKKLLAGCRGCSLCRLPYTGYVCPAACPKHLSNGICGEVQIDGTCPFNNSECVFARITRQAFQFNEFGAVENTIVPSPDL